MAAARDSHTIMLVFTPATTRRADWLKWELRYILSHSLSIKTSHYFFKVMPWPAESPDMMPVEMAFGFMKERLRAEYKPKNKAELIESILKFKEDYLTKEYCRKTIRHIHTSMTQVIRREGLPVRGKKD